VSPGPPRMRRRKKKEAGGAENCNGLEGRRQKECVAENAGGNHKRGTVDRREEGGSRKYITRMVWSLKKNSKQKKLEKAKE